MAFCTSCGSKLVDDALFCTECGAPVSPEGSSAPTDNVPLASPAIAAETNPTSAYVTPSGTSTAGIFPTESLPSTGASPSSPANSSQPNDQNAKPKPIIIIVIAAVVVVALVVGIAIALSTVFSNDEKDVAQVDVSSEEMSVTMPDLAAMTEQNAVSVLKALGLAWNVSYVDDSEKLVLEQFPEAGTEVSVGEKVSIKVGNGKSSVTSQMGKARTVVLTVANPRNGQLVSADIRLNANDEVIPDLLSRQYTADEIRAMGLSDAELYIARNSIVAKTGYIFHYEPNTQFFIDNCAWYNPSTSEYNLQGVGAVNAGVIHEVEASRGSWYLEIK